MADRFTGITTRADDDKSKLKVGMTIETLLLKICRETRFTEHEVNEALLAAINSIYEFSDSIEVSVPNELRILHTDSR